MGRISAVVRITIEKLSKIHKMSPKRRNFPAVNFQKFHKLCFSHNQPKSSKKQQSSTRHPIQLSLKPLTRGLRPRKFSSRPLKISSRSPRLCVRASEKKLWTRRALFEFRINFARKSKSYLSPQMSFIQFAQTFRAHSTAMPASAPAPASSSPSPATS